MKSLEYKVGMLKLDLSKLVFSGDDPYDATHKFIVEAIDNTVFIHIGQAVGHFLLKLKLGIPEERIVGGGSFYLNEQQELIVGDYSGAYHAIPKQTAQRFAELIKPEIEKLGVQVKGITVNPNENMMNDYWKE